MKNGIAIVLFSDDLRIEDNPAFYYAVESYEQIIPLFIYNSNYLGREIGSAAKVFLYGALNGFDLLLQNKYNARLVIRCGDSIGVLQDILKKIKANAIYFNRSYSDVQMKAESSIKDKFPDIDVKSFKAKVLFDPWEIKTGSGDYFRVFTPFSRACRKNYSLIGSVLKSPTNIGEVVNINSISISDLDLLPKKEGKWHEEILKKWSFSYDYIAGKFIDFARNGLKKYELSRNIPYENANSGISPYLRFGMLSPRWCFNIVTEQSPVNLECQFVTELLWRDFAYQVAFYNQNIAMQEIKPQYGKFYWDNNIDFLHRWQRGETGFKIVDAGMKELWYSGVMHNRVRMIVASFLIKDLLIDWRFGEQWFWDALVDADFAINPFSWQWVFGSGFDAAPYFRVFNPDSQQEKFDPHNIYCNEWLPVGYNAKKIVTHDRQRDIVLQRYKAINNLVQRIQ